VIEIERWKSYDFDSDLFTSTDSWHFWKELGEGFDDLPEVGDADFDVDPFI
jgi:hypothetical protein